MFYANMALISVDPFDRPAPICVRNAQAHNLPFPRLFLPQLQRLVNTGARNVFAAGREGNTRDVVLVCLGQFFLFPRHQVENSETVSVRADYDSRRHIGNLTAIDGPCRVVSGKRILVCKFYWVSIEVVQINHAYFCLEIDNGKEFALATPNQTHVVYCRAIVVQIYASWGLVGANLSTERVKRVDEESMVTGDGK